MIVAICVMTAILLLVAAATMDLAARLVSNWLCIALGLDGLVMQVLAHVAPWALLATLVVFVSAVVGWRHGLMGGGDVKLLGAVTLLVRPGAVPTLVLAISLAGGLLGLIYWTLARVLPRHFTHRPAGRVKRILRIERYRIRNGFALPYAIAISSGTVYVLSSGGLS